MRHVSAKIFMHKNKNACYRNTHRKTMRTISVLIVVYICTWVLSIVLTNVVIDFFDHTVWKRWMRMLSVSHFYTFDPFFKSLFTSRVFYKCCASHKRSTSVTNEALNIVIFSDDCSSPLKSQKSSKASWSMHVTRKGYMWNAYHWWLTKVSMNCDPFFPYIVLMCKDPQISCSIKNCST